MFHLAYLAKKKSKKKLKLMSKKLKTSFYLKMFYTFLRRNGVIHPKSNNFLRNRIVL